LLLPTKTIFTKTLG